MFNSRDSPYQWIKGEKLRYLNRSRKCILQHSIPVCDYTHTHTTRNKWGNYLIKSYHKHYVMPFSNYTRIPASIITFYHGGHNQCNQTGKINKKHINQDGLDYAAVHKNATFQLLKQKSLPFAHANCFLGYGRGAGLIVIQDTQAGGIATVLSIANHCI